MSSTDLTIDINTAQAQRFPAWMALTVFSAVSLAALTSGSDKNRSSAETWSLVVCAVSLSLSALAVAAYLLMRPPFVGQAPESGVLLLLTAFWSAGLPVLMNPENKICVENNQNEGLVILNANLYFFSWLSFAAILYLTGSFAQEIMGYNVTKTPPQSARWYGLCASSMVVMGSAVRAFKSSNCDLSEFNSTSYCKRTKFAIAVGTCSFCVAAVVTYLVHKPTKTLQLWVEMAFTTVLLTLWCFGVGYITFGTTPGSTISNLFFAAWISFILAVFLFAQNFREVVAMRQMAHSPANNNNPEQQQQQQEMAENDF